MNYVIRPAERSQSYLQPGISHPGFYNIVIRPEGKGDLSSRSRDQADQRAAASDAAEHPQSSRQMLTVDASKLSATLSEPVRSINSLSINRRCWLHTGEAKNNKENFKDCRKVRDGV